MIVDIMLKDIDTQKIDDMLLKILGFNGYASVERVWEVANKEFKVNISASVIQNRLNKLAETGTIKYTEKAVNEHTLKLYCRSSFVRD